MSEHTFTAEEIRQIAEQIKAGAYQASALEKADLFATIYRDPENRILVSDDPSMPIVAASILIDDDEGFELMTLCADFVPQGKQAIEYFVLAGLVQFDGEDPIAFAHLVKDEEIAGNAAAGRQMKTVVTVTLDGVEETADELAENPFFPD